jgi:antitoxin component YwqK of YwqJK toxin-antitoxin module
MKEKLKWENIYYASGVIKYEGFTYFDLKLKELVPSGQGLKYFENGNKHMEGSFGNDWFIETGKEYYDNGNIRFIGEYNKGPRCYYGPRYFIFGRLFNESGTLWYEGTFRFRRGGVGYPCFEKDKSFKDGIEFSMDGSIKQKYVDGIVQII